MEQNYVAVTLCLAGQRLSGGPYRQPRPFPLLRPNKRICYVMLCNVASNSNTVHAYCQPVCELPKKNKGVNGTGASEQGSRVSGCSPNLWGGGAVLPRKFVDVTD